MFNFVLPILLLIIFLKFFQNKIILRVDTFFRKGFKKTNDTYGIYNFVRRPTGRAKHIQLLILFPNLQASII